MDLNKSSFCYYCGKKTEIIHKQIRRSFNGRMVTIHNVPMFFCRSCREIFFPNYVINIFNAMSKLELDSTYFDFGTIFNNLKDIDKMY